MGSEAPLSRGQQLQPKQEREARRSHQSLAPYGAPAPQARLGAERNPYSTSSGIKSGSFSVKIKQGVSTNVLSKSNCTHGGGINRIHAQNKSKIRLRFDLRKANFYAWVYLKTVFFLKQIFSN